MTGSAESFDAAVVGGGFYGTAIAVYLARRRGLKRVLLLERGPSLLGRASFNNQARVHKGYHYPRSFTTGYRSRVNLLRFLNDWPDVVKTDFTNLYAVARRNSKVTSKQFERFCAQIGVALEPAHVSLRALFNPRLIEDVFLAEEFTFDASKLAKWATQALDECRVEVRYDTVVNAVFNDCNNGPQVAMTQNFRPRTTSCRYVFNCTYSGLNQIAGDAPTTRSELKHEIAELALVAVPKPLEKLGLTVVDGPFFSMMPFPARDLHTLSHVRYTPHVHWLDSNSVDPNKKLAEYQRESRVERMVRDAARYVPAIRQVRHVESLFEVKTVLVKNENDDGRPILFERSATVDGYYFVLGAKIDNVYDVLEKLDTVQFEPSDLQ